MRLIRVSAVEYPSYDMAAWLATKLQSIGRFKAVHTVYRNMQVIKQATIKQYLIVANTCQHLPTFPHCEVREIDRD